MKKIIYFLITIFLFLSCHKDEDITPTIGNCSIDDADFPIPDSNTYFNGDLNGTKLPNCYPSVVNYSPTNSNELIIWYENKAGMYIYRYDRIKKKKSLIVKDVFCSSIVNENGWIAYTKDNTLWKIKTDGSENTKIVDYFVCNLYWNTDGTMLSFFADGSFHIIKNDTVYNLSNFYDLEGYYNIMQWDYSGTKIALSGSLIYDIPTKKIISLTNTNENCFDIIWLRNGHEIIWDDWTGIYKTDIYTQETTQMRDKCKSRKEFICMNSLDGSKLIGIRYDYKYVDKRKYDIKGEVYVIEMNADGSNERRIWID